MKKRRLLILILGILLTTFLISHQTHFEAVDWDSQTSAPYLTYTLGANGYYTPTQTAYEPVGVFGDEEGVNFNAPEDMLIKDDLFYIADTGNKRIVIADLDGKIIREIRDDANFKTLSGLFVTDDHDIYIADKDAEKIFKYDFDGNKLAEFGRPTEPTFGKNSTFRPLKVAVGARDIMYVVSESSHYGLVQLNSHGEFLGYFGSNETTKSLMQRLSEIFDSSGASVLPLSPQNVNIDTRGMVYTANQTWENGGIKKFNIASVNTVTAHVVHDGGVTDVVTNDFGNIYALASFGLITEYDSDGRLLFIFGGYDGLGTGRLGLTRTPVAIDLDSKNNLYVLDKATNRIHLLEKTSFCTLVHNGMKSLNDGTYSIKEWEEVLKKNSVFQMANDAIGKAKYNMRDYESSMYYYRLSGNQAGYSDSFWYVRFTWMQNYLVYFIIGLVALLILRKALQLIDSKYGIYEPVRRQKRKLNEVKILRELRLIFTAFRHPIDTFYDIKFAKKSSVLAASVIYILTMTVYISAIYVTSFIFGAADIVRINIFEEIAKVAGVIALFILANYLISTLTGGEGWFKDIYICTAYAIVPVLLFSLPIALLSHVLTLNEAFVYYILLYFMYGLSGLYIFLMIKTIHDYKFFGTIGNILLSAFAMAIIFVLIFVVYMLFSQLFDFIFGLFGEVGIRATH